MANTWVWGAADMLPKRVEQRGEPIGERKRTRSDDDGDRSGHQPVNSDGGSAAEETPSLDDKPSSALLAGMPIVPMPAAPQVGDAVIALSLERIAREIDVGGAWLLNEGAGSFRRLGEDEMKRRLKQAGLGVADVLPDERVYRVLFFHLTPLGIVRLNVRGEEIAGSLLEPPVAHDGQLGLLRWPAEASMRAVLRAAKRAMYALRLDVGEADIALGSDGKLAVRAVYPLLRDKRRQAEVVARFAAWHAANARTEDRRLLLGADPEYALLMQSGKVAQASRYFGFGVGGGAGADAMLVGRRLMYPVAELRPDPAESPAGLAVNVRRLLARAAAKVGDPSLRWVAGGMPVPGLALGGHIHISGAALTSRLLRLLDSCAAYPLALVEDPAGRGRRPRYGALGDFRLQPHGGFEYRTLPSWLVSPAAAKAAFALALLCAREAMKLPRVPASDDRYAAAYYAGDRRELAGCLDEVADTIAATDSYRELAPYIEPLFHAARRGKTWDESVDIRVKWRIPIR